MYEPGRSGVYLHDSSDHLKEATVNAASSAIESAFENPSPVPSDTVDELERAIDYIIDDCFFSVGQVIGMRMTVDFEAILWWRDHYRAKFLAAMRVFGDRWLQDRQNVTGVAFMLAERAVRYAEGRTSIDVESARRAAADVERYCALHARRSASRADAASSDGAAPRIAGFWCVHVPS
jgi:hypothetical protein